MASRVLAHSFIANSQTEFHPKFSVGKMCEMHGVFVKDSGVAFPFAFTVVSFSLFLEIVNDLFL